MAINFTNVWGEHTQLIVDVCSGIGMGFFPFAILMICSLPWAMKDDEEFSEGWRYGREYKMNWGRKFGIWCGYLMFFCAGVYSLYLIACFFTFIGVFIKAAYLSYWG